MDYLFFENIGLTKIQTDIYLSLYKLGNQPASIIAKDLGIERTKVYRQLLNLVKLGVVKKTQKNGVQTFFIKDIEDLSKFIDKRTNSLEYLNTKKDIIIDEIKKIKLENSNFPKVSLYDNSEGVGNIFNDIWENIKQQKLITIRMFASNTYMEKNENIKSSEYASSFFDLLKQNGISIDLLIGSGNLIMERIDTLFEKMDIGDLPASQSSINIILVGKIVYFVIYNKTPSGIKIENDSLADVFHILLDIAKRYNEVKK